MLLRLVGKGSDITRTIETDDYSLDRRVQPIGCSDPPRPGWLVVDSELACEWPVPKVRIEGHEELSPAGWPVFMRLRARVGDRDLTILFQTDLYVMNGRGDTIDKVEGLRPGSWWRMVERHDDLDGSGPFWVEIQDECDRCHEKATLHNHLCERCGPAKPSGRVRDTSLQAARIKDRGPASRKVEPETVREGLGAERPIPPRMWVRVSGSEVGFAIDTDRNQSYQDNVQMAMEVVRQELRAGRSGGWMPKHCEPVGEVELEVGETTGLGRNTLP